jgi:chemotaxis protein MotB
MAALDPNATESAPAGETPAAPAPYTKKERAPDPEPPGAPEWVVTFTDMISLLVTFFVLLMTFSSMEEHELLRVSSLLRGSPGLIEDYESSRLTAGPTPDLIADTDPARGADSPHNRPSSEMPPERSQQSTAQRPDHLPVDLNRLGDGLAIAWEREAGYAAGALDPNPILSAGLRETAKAILHYPHLVVVEGHSASDFAPSAEFPDAEAESFERARRAALELINAGIEPERIQLTGHGTSRPRSVGQGADARLDNRRVELRLLTLPVSRRDRLEAVRRASETQPEPAGAAEGQR